MWLWNTFKRYTNESTCSLDQAVPADRTPGKNTKSSTIRRCRGLIYIVALFSKKKLSFDELFHVWSARSRLSGSAYERLGIREPPT